jgi:lipoyl(octanoyl) transferase
MPEWRYSEKLVPYETALAEMQARVEAISHGLKDELVWSLEHPALYTAGTSANPSDLLDTERFPIYHAGRGGQYTYHGPGQRVVYVMLDLKARRSEDIRAYVYNLESWIIATLRRFNIIGQRREGRIGIWVDQGQGREAKIAALGIRVRKWVTFHGLAINVEPDLSHFNGIVPCGLSQYGVTSFADLGHWITLEELDIALRTEFEAIFGS